MNKLLLLNYIFGRIDDRVDELNREYATDEYGIKDVDQEPSPVDEIENRLLELASFRKNQLKLPPDDLSKNPLQAITQLREHYSDDVTRISLVLSYYFPTEFVFYRVSKSERDIFSGIDFFAEVIPEFELPYSSIGRTGFERYLDFNDRLLQFAERVWPDVKLPGVRLEWFLFEHLASLFVDRDNFQRYWIVSTNPEYWDNRYAFDEGEEEGVIEWSGRKEMAPGDIVFMYGTAPTKAITDVFEVASLPRLEPSGPWDGYWVDLRHLFALPQFISFQELSTDQLISQWSVIRRQFQGVVVESMPHACFNWLLEKIPAELREQWDLKPEPLADLTIADEFATEQQFEDEVVAPLLKQWGLVSSGKSLLRPSSDGNGK